MTLLTSAIVSHNLEGIEKVVAQDRALLYQEENGWLPIEWAQRTGNFVTLARVYRVYGDEAPEFPVDQLLKEYLNLLGSDEYEPCTLEQTANMIWEQLYKGKMFKVGRWKRDLIATDGQAEDIRFLIKRAGYDSPDELISGVRHL